MGGNKNFVGGGGPSVGVKVISFIYFYHVWSQLKNLLFANSTAKETLLRLRITQKPEHLRFHPRR